MTVRDPVASSDRLTRWNSWTDGESPDGKRTRDTQRRAGCRAPGGSGVTVSLPSAPEGEDRMTSFTPVETAAMQRALRAAACPDPPPRPPPPRPPSPYFCLAEDCIRSRFLCVVLVVCSCVLVILTSLAPIH